MSCINHHHCVAEKSKISDARLCMGNVGLMLKRTQRWLGRRACLGVEGFGCCRWCCYSACALLGAQMLKQSIEYDAQQVRESLGDGPVELPTPDISDGDGRLEQLCCTEWKHQAILDVLARKHASGRQLQV
jgi:hypothetical protein